MFVRCFLITLWIALGFAARAEEPLAGLQLGSGQDLTIVMLHGDEGNGGDPLAYAAFGAEIARRLPMATVHMLLRPGYKDPWGRESPGNNYGRRDQYTLQSAALIAENLKRLKADTPLIAIGHSGGAAQLALALSLENNLAEEAILVGCACDLELWKSMNPGWPKGTITRSVSAVTRPSPVIGHVTLLVGDNDKTTPPVLSESYARHLTTHGVSVDLQIVPGGDHRGNRALSSAWLATILNASQRLLTR